nr:MAG TPA_asm: hypothetical protein [Caudoviricetes sp.]
MFEHLLFIHIQKFAINILRNISQNVWFVFAKCLYLQHLNELS